MSDKTIIAWTDHTFNIAWGCEKTSPGCRNCYAETLSARYGAESSWGKQGTRRTFGEKHWQDPLKWNRQAEAEGRRHLVFTSSMCDVFEVNQTIATERNKLWEVIRQTPWLDWQILTKRAGYIAENLPKDWGKGYPNVWLGVSIENIDYGWRMVELKKIPATVRFISYEPALGPLDNLPLHDIDWVIYGGESGPKFREHDLAWPRAMRDKCRKAGIAFFFKQSSAIRTEMGTTLDGETIREFPKPRLKVACGNSVRMWSAGGAIVQDSDLFTEVA